MFKKKQEAATARPGATGGGRSLLAYMLPAVLVGILLMLLVALVAQQAIQGAAETSAQRAAESVAAATAARIEGAVTARRDLLLLAVADGAAARALASGDAAAIDAVEADLQQRVGGLIQARLLVADASQPDPAGPAPMGYAGLDMLRRTVESGRPAAAEIHQIKTGTPYLALSVPLGLGGG